MNDGEKQLQNNFHSFKLSICYVCRLPASHKSCGDYFPSA